MKENPAIVLIDNNDSFTYNIVQVIQFLGYKIDIISYDNLDLNLLDLYSKIIISPGPDVPKSYPNIFKLLQRYKTNKSILGVCLGCQAIAEYFGSKLMQLDYPQHGIQSRITVDTDDILYQNVPAHLDVGRYHSWAIDNSSLSEDLIISSTDAQNVIMSISHKSYNICGVQYHPESIMTPNGPKILKNWIESS